MAPDENENANDDKGNDAYVNRRVDCNMSAILMARPLDLVFVVYTSDSYTLHMVLVIWFLCRHLPRASIPVALYAPFDFHPFFSTYAIKYMRSSMWIIIVPLAKVWRKSLQMASVQENLLSEVNDSLIRNEATLGMIKFSGRNFQRRHCEENNNTCTKRQSGET